MPADDSLWKEQLTLVSGNLLLWSVVLLKAYPAGAGFQTGQHLHALNLPRYHIEVTGEYLTFLALAGATAVAALLSASAILHIVSRGVWLALSKTAWAERCERVCEWSYRVSVLLLLFFLFLISVDLAFNLLTMGIKRLLLSYFHSSVQTAGYVALGGVGGLLYLLFWLIGRRLGRRWGVQLANELQKHLWSYLSYFAVIVISSIISLLIIESCYTLDLKANTVLCDRDRRDIVEVDVTLGGATSDPQYATLSLLNSPVSCLLKQAAVVEKLPLQAVGGGRYVSHIMSSALAEGAYGISLDYPHISFRTSYPFILSRSCESTGFVPVRSSASPSQESRVPQAGSKDRVQRERH